MNNVSNICPTCHQTVLDKYYFCPNCGRALKEKPMPVPVMTQIGLYALAIFLPPLGLWPGVKYIMKPGQQAKSVGIVVIILTLASTALMTWQIFVLFNSYLSQMSSVLTGF